MGRDVVITLNGHEHTLRFSLSAWSAAESQGFKLDPLFQGLKDLSMQAVGVCLWAMLQEETPRPSLVDVQSWVNGENFAQVMEKMGEAIRVSFPSPPSPSTAAPSP